MVRFLFRLLATVALAIAVILAVLDATRSVAASALVLTPLDASWRDTSPDTLAAAEILVRTGLHPVVWDSVVTTVLGLPGFVVFLTLALLLYAVGHRPQPRLGQFATE